MEDPRLKSPCRPEGEPTIVIVSQALSVPARRRTWQQALALSKRNWNVRVICPRRTGQQRRELVGGIEIVRFLQPIDGKSRTGLLIEYGCSVVAIAADLFLERMRGKIEVVQVVNPPDWLIPLAVCLRPFGSRIVYDMADLSPLLYEAKFESKGPFYSALACLNRLALRTADLVVASNEVYRRLAVRLRGRGHNCTIALQSFPDRFVCTGSTRPAGPLRVGYFGVFGTHDGIDVLLKAAARLQSSRTPDFEVVIVGDGPAMSGLRSLSSFLRLDERARFVGFLQDDDLETAIASFDIAVIPDPLNRYTRSISLNKAFIYAAQGLPIVATPLPGTRRLLGSAAVFSEDDSPAALADAIHALLLDDGKRKSLGIAARTRAETTFDWTSEASRYVAAVEALLPGHKD